MNCITVDQLKVSNSFCEILLFRFISRFSLSKPCKGIVDISEFIKIAIFSSSRSMPFFITELSNLSILKSFKHLTTATLLVGRSKKRVQNFTLHFRFNFELNNHTFSTTDFKTFQKYRAWRQKIEAWLQENEKEEKQNAEILHKTQRRHYSSRRSLENDSGK